MDSQSPHGHQKTPHSHAFAETHHHTSFGQTFSQLPQKTIKVLLPGVAVNLVRVSDAQAFLSRQFLEGLHATFPVVSCRWCTKQEVRFRAVNVCFTISPQISLTSECSRNTVCVVKIRTKSCPFYSLVPKARGQAPYLRDIEVLWGPPFIIFFRPQ